MHFLRSKSHQLADHLRGCIARGELREPLPNLRTWSTELGVGLHTLEAALQILHAERVVRIRPRKGVEILGAGSKSGDPQLPRAVRWICYTRDFPDLSPTMEMLDAIAEQLRHHGIGFHIERCDAVRLRSIHARGELAHEMVLLTSLPAEFLELFSSFKRSALINGLPTPGVSLPYISIDVFAAVRHAVHVLARHGFPTATLVIKTGTRQPIIEAFRRYCAEADPPMHPDVVTMPIELEAQVEAAGRFAAGGTGRRGVVAVYSIPASVLMTALMARGVKVPGQVEVIAVNTTLQAVRVYPLPTHYPMPVTAFAKAVSRAAIHYFERGRLPRLRKVIPLEMVAGQSL